MRRINISLDDLVDDKAKEFCKAHNINRSALISVALMDYISAQEKMPEIQSQLDELKKAIEMLQMK